MRRIRLMLLTVFAFVAISGQSVFAAGSGKIAFISYVDGYPRLYLMNSDGSGRIPFDPPEVQAGPPAWSPDGTKIAYARNDPNDSAHSGLVVAAVDGSSILKIATGGAPAWSPDGSRIAFGCARSICVINADGTGLTTVLAGGVADINTFPTWSPDATQIAYGHNIDLGSGLFTRQIFVMGADGSSPHNVSNTTSWDDHPSWGPDGRIAFMAGREVVAGIGIYKIYVMNGDGSNQHAVSPELASEYYPAWSSDGSGIAFTSDRDSPGCDLDCRFEIYTMTATGQNVTRLTFDNSYAYYPAWYSTGGVVVDTTPPAVDCLGGATGWTNANVTVACTATDGGTGLADPTDANPGFSLFTTVADGVEDANAMTGSHQVCDLATPANCTTAQRGPFMVDRKAPTIAITAPANNAGFVLAQPVSASYTCSESGSGIQSCTGTVPNGSSINTASVGTKPFTVNASDQVGNVATPVNWTYTVSFDVKVLGSNHNVTVRLLDFLGANRSSPSITLTIQSIDGNPVSGQVFTLQNNGSYRYTPPSGFDRGTHTLTFIATGDPVPHSVNFKY